MKKDNIFSRIPNTIPDEIFDTIIQNDNVKIERIISDGHTTPIDRWYDQERDEWVILLKGIAEILFENEPQPVTLKPGDHVLIPAFCRHRVTRTDEKQPTVWLAIHMKKP
ncbi:MAG: cupin protein [Deltaproteobacteria bacterium]|nr:cupin protein [Deltaproteobacteria bacterium]